MIVGIDVGGTFTDGIIYHNGEIEKSVKTPTDPNNLRDTVLASLDSLLANNTREIERLVLSTTLVTNALVTGRLEKVGLIIMPGPGINPEDLYLPDNCYVVGGAIDFRGREIQPLDIAQLSESCLKLVDKDIKKLAVVGKFSQRNPAHELEAAQIIKAQYPGIEVLMGHKVSSRLNFPRRATTTYFTLATKDEWSHFADEIEWALSIRGIRCPVDIMKADGGTMSLQSSREAPCETVFSGPAASTMGALAIAVDDQTSVMIDIGGTTSDLAFILEGKPLYASRGAKIKDRYTHINALALDSIPLGGDSTVKLLGETIIIGPGRAGNAACFGGSSATPTDALNIISGGALGGIERSRQALAELTPAINVEQLAHKIVDSFVSKLHERINYMMKSWEEEPVYKVWEVVNRRRVKIDRIIGIGAAASGLIPKLAERMNCQSLIHRYSPVGNALGTVVARPTLQLLLHADIQQGIYTAAGRTSKLDRSRFSQLKDVKALAVEELKRAAQERGGMEHYLDEIMFFREEQFNVVKGWNTVGKIFDLGLMIAPGLAHDFKGVMN